MLSEVPPTRWAALGKNSNDEPVRFPGGALFITRFKQAAQRVTLSDVTSVRHGDT